MAEKRHEKKNIKPPRTNSAKPSRTPPVRVPKGNKGTGKKGK